MSLLKLCVVVCHPVYVFVHQSKYELCPCQCQLFAANAHVHLGYHNFKVKYILTFTCSLSEKQEK